MKWTAPRILVLELDQATAAATVAKAFPFAPTSSASSGFDPQKGLRPRTVAHCRAALLAAMSTLERRVAVGAELARARLPRIVFVLGRDGPKIATIARRSIGVKLLAAARMCQSECGRRVRGQASGVAVRRLRSSRFTRRAGAPCSRSIPSSIPRCTIPGSGARFATRRSPHLWTAFTFPGWRRFSSSSPARAQCRHRRLAFSPLFWRMPAFQETIRRLAEGTGSRGHLSRPLWRRSRAPRHQARRFGPVRPNARNI